MKPTAKWLSRSLPTPAPNRETFVFLKDDLWCWVDGGGVICVVYWFVLCRESCQKGWRLMYILTAFHRCSDVMKPFLLRFLQDACDGPGMPYQGKTSIHPVTTIGFDIKSLITFHNYESIYWLLVFTDRYCQGLWTEPEEDFSIWWTCSVSQQHGAQSHAG